MPFRKRFEKFKESFIELASSLFCPPCPVECEAYSSGVSRKGKNIFL